MSKRERTGKPCEVPGCKNFCVHGEDFCEPHLRQYHSNLAAGDPNPRPTRLGRNHRLCRVVNCHHYAVPYSGYCPMHAAQYHDPRGSVDLIAAEFDALAARLNEDPPDTLAAVMQELDLLKTVRKILVAYTEAGARSGWQALSALSFQRLWLSSATTANELLKTRYVIESAQAGHPVGPLTEAYDQLEAMPGLQQLLKGVATPGEHKLES